MIKIFEKMPQVLLRTVLGGGLVILAVWWFGRSDGFLDSEKIEVMTPVSESVTVHPVAPPREQASIVPPLDRATERVTKKPFGILVDRATSPVQPERFSGYHTGTDLEVFSEEAMTDVEVRAMCRGEVVVKRSASGYGGLLVTDCTIDDKKVTVVYGHLRLSSIGVEVGDQVAAGDQIGVLGAGGSDETDGERKHLHLGIHLGSTVNIQGYFTAKSDLSGWIDPCQYVCVDN